MCEPSLFSSGRVTTNSATFRGVNSSKHDNTLFKNIYFIPYLSLSGTQSFVPIYWASSQVAIRLINFHNYSFENGCQFCLLSMKTHLWHISQIVHIDEESIKTWIELSPLLWHPLGVLEQRVGFNRNKKHS